MSSRNDPQEVYQKVKGWCEDLRRRVNSTEVVEVMRLVPTFPARTFPYPITIRGNLTVLASSTVTKVGKRATYIFNQSESIR